MEKNKANKSLLLTTFMCSRSKGKSLKKCYKKFEKLTQPFIEVVP